MAADVIIIGASVRAAAQSVMRAGLTPWCADLFSDTDLLQSVPDAVQLPFAQYPDNFLDLFDNTPNVPWMYTGGLENYPDLIDQLATKRTLWGNDGNVLRRVRDPFFLEQVFLEAGLPVLEVRRAGTPLPNDRLWLRKPLQGSAGQGIEFAQLMSQTVGACYFQEFMDGVPMSAVFVAWPEFTTLQGCTRQLIGTAWLNADGFRYAGNIGPVLLNNSAAQLVRQLGTTLAQACHLRGLFGIDFVLANNTPYLVEVNPRYTASVEVLERGGPDVTWHHALACGMEQTRVLGVRGAGTASFGKAIVYAARPVTITSQLATQLRRPTNADIPKDGDVIPVGWPILTLFAASDSEAGCESQLREQAAEVDRLLAGTNRVS